MDYSEISTTLKKTVIVSNFLSIENVDELISGIYDGLNENQKYISSRFFYDGKGSSLFEEITTIPEYYLTRTEKLILKTNAQSIVGDFEKLDIIELGSGDCSKISILLDAIPKNKIANVRYLPVDISEPAILKSADKLSLKYQGLKIHGLLADFMKHLNHLPYNCNRLICFFGSTLGNLNRKQAGIFLLNLKKIMKPGDKFILGLDMVKDTRILHNAYNDMQGITASFNKNILDVINNVAVTNFDPQDFEHLAWYNKEKKRVEMHLKALNNTVVTSKFFPKEVSIVKGETIHTENSHKFTPEHIARMELISGLKINETYTDDKQYFSIVKFEYPERY